MIRIASWNVNSLRVRLEQVVEYLLSNQIDILCLQETKVIDDAGVDIETGKFIG